MAWIESHQSLSRHRKTLRLAALLKEDKHKLIGHLHELWWWALDNVPSDGDLGDLGDDELAFGAEWPGDPKGFVAALTTAGFIDVDEDGTRRLHDWYDYAGKLLDRRAADRERKRKPPQSPPANPPQEIQRNSDGNPTEFRTDSVRTQPTQPNQQTKREIPSVVQAQNRPTRQPAKRPEYTPEFLAFWDAYPRRVGKSGAFDVWQARLGEGTDPQAMIDGAKRYAAACKRDGTEQRFIKHPATFIGPQVPFEDFLGDGGEAAVFPTEEEIVATVRRQREAQEALEAAARASPPDPELFLRRARGGAPGG